MTFDDLYKVSEEYRRLFGRFWKGPRRFLHGKWCLVAEYPKDPPGGDGLVVRLYESRMPARFYKVEAVPTEIRRGFTLSTGSGPEMLGLAIRIAEEAARGMIGSPILLGLEPEEKDERAILSGASKALVDLEGHHGPR